MKKLYPAGIVAIVLSISGIGFSFDPSDYDVRFASPDGYTTINKTDNQYATDVVIDDSTNVFIAMIVETTDGSTGQRPAVMKLKTSGEIDSSFGTNGIYVIPADINGDRRGNFVDIGLASDHKIYVSFAGIGGTPSSENFVLCRILSDGSDLDTSFGSAGLSTMAFDMVGGAEPGRDEPYDLLVQLDGKIVLVGGVERADNNKDIGIVRFTSSGAADSNFGTAGKVIIYFDLGGSKWETAFGVTQTTTGEIIVVGNTQTTDGYDISVMALNSDGTMVSTFGTSGQAHYAYFDPFSGLMARYNHGFSVTTARPEIKEATGEITDTILVAGGTADPGLVDGTRDMAVLCLKGDGSVCPGFGTGGWSLIDFSDNSIFGIGNTDDSPRSIHWDYLTGLVTITGKVTQTTGAGDTYPAIARIAQSDGSLDTSFGTVGHRNYTQTSGERFYGTISPSGNIVVVGAVDTGSPSDFDVWAARIIGSETLIFYDTFASGDTNRWSQTFP